MENYFDQAQYWKKIAEKAQASVRNLELIQDSHLSQIRKLEKELYETRNRIWDLQNFVEKQKEEIKVLQIAVDRSINLDEVINDLEYCKEKLKNLSK
jgi:TolA-binding protein